MQVAELTDQLEQMQKIKVKIEKDKQQIQRELEDATQTADSELRARQEAEKVIKNLELQLGELQTKADEQSRLLNDFAALKSRLQNENGDLEHQVEDLENQVNGLGKGQNVIIPPLLPPSGQFPASPQVPIDGPIGGGETHGG
jgi:uncharacterized protein involved in exopolysaccharide biosynthesis